jgi:hypothetical protein
MRKQKELLVDFCDWCEKEIAVSGEGDFANLTPIIMGNNELHFHFECLQKFYPLIFSKLAPQDRIEKFNKLWEKLNRFYKWEGEQVRRT